MIGTHDGTTGKSYEDHFDYLIDNPVYVTPNVKVTANVIQGNLRDMDLQIGADYIPREAPITSSTMAPQAPTEPAGAIPGSYRTLPSGAFQPARLGTIEDDTMPPNAKLAMMEGMKIPGVTIRGGESPGGGGIGVPANRNHPDAKGDTWHPKNPGGPGQINDSYQDAYINKQWDILRQMDQKLKDIEKRSKFKVVPKED